MVQNARLGLKTRVSNVLVFKELPQDDKSRLLSQLAAKVFSHAVGI